jgi:hypothetical protein
MSCQEIVTMCADIATVGAMIFAGWAILMTRNSINLQRKSTQAQLFSDISSRIRELEDQFAGCVSLEDIKRWYERLFNAWEYFAFFVNRKEISPEMSKYYRSGIITYVKRLSTKKEYSDLLEQYKKRPKEEFCELRQYYKNETGADLPF